MQSPKRRPHLSKHRRDISASSTAPAPDGERVVTIDPQGPAAAAGIKVGDTLVKFDGQSLTPQNSLVTQMRPKKAAQNVTLSVRDSAGNVEEKSVTLRERSTALPRIEGRMPADSDRVPGLVDMIDRAQFMQPGPRPMLGVTVAEVDPDLRERLKLGNVTGVLINEVRANTPAADAKLQANDVIQSVDNQQVTNPAELQRIVAGAKPDSQVKLKSLPKRPDDRSSRDRQDDDGARDPRNVRHAAISARILRHGPRRQCFERSQ